MVKGMIASKAGGGVVRAARATAARCVQERGDLRGDGAHEAGAPEGSSGCMGNVTRRGAKELMNGRETDLIGAFFKTQGASPQLQYAPNPNRVSAG